MSFGVQESSRDRGEPVELYLFRYGPDPLNVFAYTNADSPIVFDDGITGPLTYQAVPITRDAITASGTLDKSTLVVKTSRAQGIADLFRNYPPSSVVNLRIRQGHTNDPSSQFLINWSGRVIGFRVQGAESQYTCEPISTSLRRAGLRRNYQYGCPHVLYGPQCRASKAAATLPQIVLTVSRAVITVSPTWVPDARKPKYQNGLAEWTTADGRTERRGILRVVGGTITLDGRAAGLTPGMSVKLILGCDHQTGLPGQTGDCLPLHNNIQNYGGQPWIPLKNPIGYSNNQYY